MSIENTFQDILKNLKGNDSAFVKIALIGQPGAGKSSIINALVGQRVAETGVHTDTTKDAKEYRYNFNMLVDLPGYGTNMFNVESWKERFKPEQYDVFVFVFSGKLMKEDVMILNDLLYLQNSDFVRHPIFFVRNHSEDIANEEDRNRICEDIYSKITESSHTIPLYFVDCRYKTGFKELAVGFQCINYKNLWEQRIIRFFRQRCRRVLNECEEKARKAIDSHKYAAAANGINPLPGVDVAADIGIYLDMFSDIRDSYNIENEDLDRFSVMPVVKKIIELATKNGIIILLKSYAGRVAVKNTLKYIPIIGWVASAGLGYKLCEWAGEEYIDDCNGAANEILDSMINSQLKDWANNDSMIVLGGN